MDLLQPLHYTQYELDSKVLEAPQAFYPCILIVQARMGSTRLPGKVLMNVSGRPLLTHLVARLRRVPHIDGLVIATTSTPQDDVIEAFCNQHSLHCFRGSEEDVLSRYYEAAKSFGAEVVIRITADCPLMDPGVLSQAITCFRQNYEDLDYFSNTLRRTFPRGLDIEMMRFSVLEKAFFEAKTAYSREHVTPFIIHNAHQFRLGNFFSRRDLSKYRLTVDTKEDFELITKIITAFEPEKPDFTLDDMVTLLEKHPEWKGINAHVRQKT
jgi:spore coat polysaccharide biosynthesis protein SpsF